MKITLDSNPSDAPCCLKIVAEDGRDMLVQTDWDWPSIASSFGWSLTDVQPEGLHWNKDNPCDHSGTDGTVDCPCCGLTAHDFIQAARAFMDDNDGATAEDPGYFA